MRYLALLLATGLTGFLLLLPQDDALAQYEEPRGFEPSIARYFSVGFMQRTFEPRPSNIQTADSLRITFTRMMPMFGFHQGPLDILLGFVNYGFHGGSRSTVFLGTTIRSEIPVVHSRSFGLLLPIMLGADFTKAEAAGAELNDFNVASVGIGGGVKFRARSESVEFMVETAGLAQYAVEGFSTRTGFSGAVIAESSLLWNGVGPFDGVVLGYRFRYQTWNLGEHLMDYKSVSHGPYLGLMF